MSRSGCEKDKQRDVVRALAAQDLQLLLGAEPHLAKAFRVLPRRSKSDELRTICKEGVSYTLQRVGRIKEAHNKIDTPLVSEPSSGLDGLIKDARRAATRTKSVETDVASLAAIERISRFGLAIKRIRWVTAETGGPALEAGVIKTGHRGMQRWRRLLLP